MLSGPANDYFGDAHHLRGIYPTPQESSLRTGLTPGGSGSMFPAPSPNSQAIFAQLASGSATPGTLDFHRTALSAAAAKRESTHSIPTAQPQVTSQPASDTKTASAAASAPSSTATKPGPTNSKPTTSGPFDPHDNDAANGLFLLAQGRNGTSQSSSQHHHQYATTSAAHTNGIPAPTAPINANNVAATSRGSISTSPQMRSINGGESAGERSARGHSEAAHSAMSDDSEQHQPKPPTRGKGKRNNQSSTTTATTNASNNRRKAEEPPAKGPASKKAKTSAAAAAAAAAASVPAPVTMTAPTLATSSSALSMMDSSMHDNSSEHSDDDMKMENGQKVKMTDEEKRKNFLERNR